MGNSGRYWRAHTLELLQLRVSEWGCLQTNSQPPLIEGCSGDINSMVVPACLIQTVNSQRKISGKVLQCLNLDAISQDGTEGSTEGRWTGHPQFPTAGEKPAVCPTVATLGIALGKPFILQCQGWLVEQEESQNLRAGSNHSSYLKSRVQTSLTSFAILTGAKRGQLMNLE